jgi:tetratricopeptide (TPR) repeat protein
LLLAALQVVGVSQLQGAKSVFSCGRPSWAYYALAVCVILGSAMSFAQRLVLAFAVAVACSAVAASGAAEPSAGEIAVARKLYREAVALEEAAKWSEAEAKLREAIAIKETPGLRFHLAVTQEKQGKLVEALVDYDRAEEMVQRGTRAPDVEQLLGSAREAVRARIPTVTVKAPADAKQLALSIDGKAFAPSLVGKPIPLNPGKHTVRLTAAGAKPYQSEFTLAESEELGVQAKLEPEVAAPAAGSAGSTSAPVDLGEAGSSSSARNLVLLGEAAFTVAALAVGIGFMLYRADRQEQVDKAQGYIDADTKSCTNPAPAPGSAAMSACDAMPGLTEERDNAAMWAMVGFIGAGVGAAAMVGTYLLWKPERRDSSARFGAAPIPGGAALGIAGAF